MASEYILLPIDKILQYAAWIGTSIGGLVALVTGAAKWREHVKNKKLETLAALEAEKQKNLKPACAAVDPEPRKRKSFFCF